MILTDLKILILPIPTPQLPRDKRPQVRTAVRLNPTCPSPGGCPGLSLPKFQMFGYQNERENDLLSSVLGSNATARYILQ